MPGRFPLFTDEDIKGPLISALRQRGWDLEHALEVYGEQTDDDVLFEHAVREGRVLVSTDKDHLPVARQWAAKGKPFRMIFWKQGKTQRVRVSAFLAAFDAIAAKENAFAAGIEYLKIEG